MRCVGEHYVGGAVHGSFRAARIAFLQKVCGPGLVICNPAIPARLLGRKLVVAVRAALGCYQ